MRTGRISGRNDSCRSTTGLTTLKPSSVPTAGREASGTMSRIRKSPNGRMVRRRDGKAGSDIARGAGRTGPEEVLRKGITPEAGQSAVQPGFAASRPIRLCQKTGVGSANTLAEETIPWSCLGRGDARSGAARVTTAPKARPGSVRPVQLFGPRDGRQRGAEPQPAKWGIPEDVPGRGEAVRRGLKPICISSQTPARVGNLLSDGVPRAFDDRVGQRADPGDRDRHGVPLLK